ncbi:MAG: hypothetical protein WD532_03105 [Acidimicrobiia bacterium]
MYEERITGEFSVIHVVISGIVLSVDEEEVVLQGEDTMRTAWVVNLALGENPETGEQIVGRFLIAASGEPEIGLGRCRIPSWFLREDPLRGAYTGKECDFPEPKDAPSLLEEGKQYAFVINTAIYCDTFPTEYRKQCEDGEDIGRSLLSYNEEIVLVLKRGGAPPDGMGFINTVYIMTNGRIPTESLDG